MTVGVYPSDSLFDLFLRSLRNFRPALSFFFASASPNCREVSSLLELACLLNFARLEPTYPYEPILGLKFECLLGVVNEGETGRFSTSELSPEPKHNYLILWGLVHGSELVP